MPPLQDLILYRSLASLPSRACNQRSRRIRSRTRAARLLQGRQVGTGGVAGGKNEAGKARISLTSQQANPEGFPWA